VYTTTFQHSSLAKGNPRQIIEEDNTDIIFIKETFTIRSKIAGLSKKLKISKSGEGKDWATTEVKNNKLVTMFLR